jgi:hypothetical protein
MLEETRIVPQLARFGTNPHRTAVNSVEMIVNENRTGKFIRWLRSIFPAAARHFRQRHAGL